MECWRFVCQVRSGYCNHPAYGGHGWGTQGPHQDPDGDQAGTRSRGGGFHGNTRSQARRVFTLGGTTTLVWSAPMASNAATAVTLASASSISEVVGARPMLLPGQSVDQYTQGVLEIIKELGVSTHMQRYLAQKIFDCIWEINNYEIATRGIVANQMIDSLLEDQSDMQEQTISVVQAVFAGDWANAQIVQLLDDCGHTPESLYAESLGKAQGKLIHIEQLRAIRTKSMLQLQGAYEALVNRSILRERLHMQNELMRRDLRAIEVKADTAGVDLKPSN